MSLKNRTFSQKLLGSGLCLLHSPGCPLFRSHLTFMAIIYRQGRSEDYPFRGGCKTTFCRQKGVASARLGRGQSEPYSFLSDVQQLTPSSKIIYFNLFLK